MSAQQETRWETSRRIDEEDYCTFGEPAPWWDAAEEEREHLERQEAHHDFIFRAPVRESDDWLPLAA